MAELRVPIRVRPGASRTAVGGVYGEALVVRVQESAGGRATEAALRAVAAAVGVARRDVRLITGHLSRDKVLAITGEQELLGPILDRLRDAT